MKRPRLDSPRRCGSIPATLMPTTAWGRFSPATINWRRPRLISPKLYGSIPATAKPTTTWVLYSIIEASPRRRRLISPRRLRLNPNYVDAHINLGTILSRQKRYAEAEPHFAMAARLRPDDAQAHYSLGNVLSGLCHYPTASAQFAEAMRLQPGDPNAYNATALIMAACPEPRFRDGKKAVGFATRACELTKWKDPLSLNALAAAQAEAGEFVAAISSQKRALELLTDGRQKADYRFRLALYQAKKPYRQP